MGEHTVPQAWEEHHHEGIVHTHDHYHVTHNFNVSGLYSFPTIPMAPKLIGRGWKIIRRENRSHTRHRKGFARIDALYPRMRQWAE